MGAVYRRELQAFFYSPLAYVFCGIFLLGSGVLFALSNLITPNGSMSAVFSSLVLLFVFLIPVLTMRLFTEERKQKTDQLLLTSPTTLWSVVVGKYLAACTVYGITLLFTGVYVIILAVFGTPAYAEILGNYIGVFLLGCAMLAVGTFISAMTESQMVAIVISIIVNFMLYMLDGMTSMVNNTLAVSVLNGISLFRRYVSFNGGQLSPASIFYMLSFCVLFLFLAVQAIERRRWSEG